MKNKKRFDRKGGKFSQKWLGPYTVMNISDKGVVTLQNASGVTLKSKYNIVQLQLYIQGAEDKSKSIQMKKLYVVQQLKNSFPRHKWRPSQVPNQHVLSGIV